MQAKRNWIEITSLLGLKIFAIQICYSRVENGCQFRLNSPFKVIENDTVDIVISVTTAIH